MINLSFAQNIEQPKGYAATVIEPEALTFYHKDDEGEAFENVRTLKDWLAPQNKAVRFATNGGIFMQNLTPLGLYIENGELVRDVNLVKRAFGNFYLQPNGIFTISDVGNAEIMLTDDYADHENITYAIQSGPMLVIDGKPSPRLLPDSRSRKIRNGVGTLDNGDVLFLMATRPVIFYDFAQQFISMGADQALYLDGSISMHYEPELGRNYDGGEFSVLITEVVELVESEQEAIGE